MKHSQCRIKANLFHVEAKVKEMLYMFLNPTSFITSVSRMKFEGEMKKAQRQQPEWLPRFAPD